MNDDTLDPMAELASAAFDGEVTAHERAQVAVAAGTATALEFAGELRARLADVAVPDAARNAALSAALHLFDELRTGESTPTAAADTATAPGGAVIVELNQRRRLQMRWLGAAAAAVAVVAVGAAVLNRDARSDTSRDQAAFAPAESAFKVGDRPPAQVDTSATLSGVVESVASAETSAAEPTAGAAAAEAATAADTTADSAAAIVAADATQAPAETAAADEPLPVIAMAVPDLWSGAMRFTTASELAAFVRQPDFGARNAFASTATTEVTATTAAATETTTDGTATTDPNAAIVAGMVATPSPDTYAMSCVSGLTDPYDYVFYGDVQVIAVLDQSGDIRLLLPDPSCTVFAVITPD